MNAQLHPALVGLVVALAACTAAPSVCSAAAGQDKKDSKSSGDLKKLQGVWTTPSQSGEAVVYTFKEDKLTVKAPTRTYKMTVKLDESAKPNKTIDLKVDDGPEDAKGQTSKGSTNSTATTSSSSASPPPPSVPRSSSRWASSSS